MYADWGAGGGAERSGKSSDASLRDLVRLIDGNLVTFDQRDRKSLYPRRTYTGIIPRLLA